MKETFYILTFILFSLMAGCAHLPGISLGHKGELSAAEYVTLGNTYMAKDDKDLAKRQYETALRQDKRYMPALAALGNLAYEDRDWKIAGKYFKKMVKLEPNNLGALNNLALVEMNRGDLKYARALAERALPIAGSLEPYVKDTLAQIEAARTAPK